ncbi:hypothetical protein CR513_47675, partial [Mucuna pruriens]
MSLRAGRSSLLQNWLNSKVSPLSFLTSTTKNDGVTANSELPFPPPLLTLQPHFRLTFLHVELHRLRHLLQPRNHATRGARRRESYLLLLPLLLLEQRRQIETLRKRNYVKSIHRRLFHLLQVQFQFQFISSRSHHALRYWFFKPGRFHDLGNRDSGFRVRVKEPGPDIGLGAVVAFFPDDLRRDVRRRAACGVQQAVLPEVLRESAEAEVGDLEVAVLVEEEVLRFEVAVVDAAAVTEVDGGDELLEVESSHLFPEAAAGDLVEELPAADEFHGDVDLGFASHDFEEIHDVGVLHHVHRRDLPLDLLHHPYLHHFLFPHHLHRHALSALQVARVVHLREGAVAQ